MKVSWICFLGKIQDLLTCDGFTCPQSSACAVAYGVLCFVLVVFMEEHSLSPQPAHLCNP